MCIRDCGQLRNSAGGQAAVELSLLLPVLLLLAFGLLDLGRVFYYQEAITNAAREGARYGAGNGCKLAGINARLVSEIAPLTVNSALSVSNPAGSTITTTVRYDFRLITPLIGEVVGTPIQLQATSRFPCGLDYAADPT